MLKKGLFSTLDLNDTKHHLQCQNVCRLCHIIEKIIKLQLKPFLRMCCMILRKM